VPGTGEGDRKGFEPMRIPIIFLFLLVILSSCVSTNVVKYPNINYPPTDYRNIVVYHNFPPTTKYEAIGEVVSEGAPAAKWNKVYDKMKKEAAVIGGDAIVIQQKEEQFSMINVNAGTVLYKKNVVGIVIKFTNQDSG